MMSTAQLRASGFLTLALIPLSGGERYELGKKVQNQKNRFADPYRRHKYNPKRKEMLEGLGVIFPLLIESLPAMAQVRACIALLSC